MLKHFFDATIKIKEGKTQIEKLVFFGIFWRFLRFLTIPMASS